MKQSKILLAAYNKLRDGIHQKTIKSLPSNISYCFYAMIEDADSYAEYGYPKSRFIAENPTVRGFIEQFGHPAEEFCKLLYSIGYAQCAEDKEYEEEKWTALQNWAAQYIRNDECLEKTKTLELIDRIPTGEVIPKRILAVLVKAGVIDSYSQWGYLDGDMDLLGRTVEYKGRYFTAKYLDGCFYPYLIKAKITPRRRIDMLQFKGDFRRDHTCCVTDIMMGRLWNMHYQTKVRGTDFINYFSKKEKAFKVPITRISINLNRRMSVFGSIV